MTRIAENQLNAQVVSGIYKNKARVARYSNEVSSGLKVAKPGDSNLSGSISQFRENLVKTEGYKNRLASVKSGLENQDNIMAEMHELLIRAKELASQGASETNSQSARAHIAEEVFQIRDHMAQLANTKYQGNYVFGGAVSDTPPVDVSNFTYAEPASGPASQRYVFDALPGRDKLNTVNITDDLQLTVNSAATDLFRNSMEALERLGRSLAGYTTNPAVGTPDGTGAQFDFANGGYSVQTEEITTAIDLIDVAREEDILTERAAIGGKMRRLDTADSLLELSKVNDQEVLDRLQNADIVDSASQLAQAETALQASYTVSSRILSLTILDYI